MGNYGGTLGATAPRLFVPAFIHPTQEPSHPRTLAPHQPEKTARIRRGLGCLAKESLHTPADVGAAARPQPVAFCSDPVVSQRNKHEAAGSGPKVRADDTVKSGRGLVA